MLFYANHDRAVDPLRPTLWVFTAVPIAKQLSPKRFPVCFQNNKTQPKYLIRPYGEHVDGTNAANRTESDSSYLTKPRSITMTTRKANVIEIRSAYSSTQKWSRFQRFSVFQNDTITFMAVFKKKKTLYLEKYDGRKNLHFLHWKQ